jgi:hypothetical protein
MQHVISSTASGTNSNNPTIVWAEEGISTGAYTGGSSDKFGGPNMTIRCVRNLGDVGNHIMNGNNPETYALDQFPDDYIVVEETASGDDSHIISTTHLNDQALRYYTSRELPLADQNSVESRLYKKYAVYKERTTSGNGVSFVTFNENIDADIRSGVKNRYCPPGYRTPNQRELAIMLYYDIKDTQPCWSRTVWSFGEAGSNDKDQGKYGFSKQQTLMTVANYGDINGTRCVRDIRVD